MEMGVIEFQTDITSLSDQGLHAYIHFLLDKILCKPVSESLRTKILDRIEQVHDEQVKRGIREATPEDL